VADEVIKDGVVRHDVVTEQVGERTQGPLQALSATSQRAQEKIRVLRGSSLCFHDNFEEHLHSVLLDELIGTSDVLGVSIG
jgi:hypothetical protein